MIVKYNKEVEQFLLDKNLDHIKVQNILSHTLYKTASLISFSWDNKIFTDSEKIFLFDLVNTDGGIIFKIQSIYNSKYDIVFWVNLTKEQFLKIWELKIFS